MLYTPHHGFRFKRKLFSLDGSLTDLSMKAFSWADYNNKKAAFKLHAGLDHEELIPGFAAITSGKVTEVEQADQWTFPRCSVLIFDKRYNSYVWHNTLAEKGYIWVTRIQENALYRVIE